MKMALTEIPDRIKGLIEAHKKDLEEAWANCGEEPLSISFPVKIGFDKNSKGTCEISISFTKEKVKDSVSFFWNDKQIDLPLKKAIRDLAPDGKTLTSIKISSGGETVTLTPEDKKRLDKEIKEEVEKKEA